MRSASWRSRTILIARKRSAAAAAPAEARSRKTISHPLGAAVQATADEIATSQDNMADRFRLNSCRRTCGPLTSSAGGGRGLSRRRVAASAADPASDTASAWRRRTRVTAMATNK